MSFSHLNDLNLFAPEGSFFLGLNYGICKKMVAFKLKVKYIVLLKGRGGGLDIWTISI